MVGRHRSLPRMGTQCVIKRPIHICFGMYIHGGREVINDAILWGPAQNGEGSPLNYFVVVACLDKLSNSVRSTGTAIDKVSSWHSLSGVQYTPKWLSCETL